MDLTRAFRLEQLVKAAVSSDRYEIETPSDVESGSVKVSPSKAEKDVTVTATVTPDDGYGLDKLAIHDEDGDKLDLGNKNDGKFTFEIPKGDVEIAVSFTPIAEETTDSFLSPFVKKERLWLYKALIVSNRYS